MQIPPKFGDIEFPPKIQQASSWKKCEYNSNLILLGIHTFFGFASMSSLAKKLKEELQAFLKILILIARGFERKHKGSESFGKGKGRSTRGVGAF